MAHMNVSLAEELIAELARTVPRRKRSAFVAAAVAEKLARERQALVAKESAGIWGDDGRGDATDEVRQRREEWTDRLRGQE